MAKAPSKSRTASKSTPRCAEPKAGTRVKSKPTPAAVIRAQMPGWQIAKGTVAATGFLKANDMKTDKGPSIDQLRRKFLGTQDAGAERPTIADVNEGVQTVRIRPKDGGPAKTADIRDGKISIVQG